MAPASFKPSNVAMQIAIEIGACAKEHGLGELTGADCGSILARGPDTVLAPDVAYR